MRQDAASLNTITDIDVLRALVLEKVEAIAARDAYIEQRDTLIAERDRTITYKDAKTHQLTHEIACLRRLQYAAKTERMDPAQRELFDEAMAADIAALEGSIPLTRYHSKVEPLIAEFSV